MSATWWPGREEALRIVRIDRALQVNSTAYERAPRLLLAVAAAEMALNVCLLAFLPVFCRIVWKSGVVHRNFRLQLCTSAVYYSLGIIGRCYLFYAQYSGKPDEELLPLIIPAQFARTAGNVFAVSLSVIFAQHGILCFAFERSVATFCWSWYERGSPSTIIVYFLTESINMSMFALCMYFKYRLSSKFVIAQTVLIAIAGFFAFRYIYRKNLLILDKMKSGAEFGTYAVARSFQVKENVEVLKCMLWMGRGWIFATVSSFIFYGYFAAGPSGYETSRALSYNIFQLCVALHFAAFYTLSISGNEHILRRFREFRIARVIMRVLGCRRLNRAIPRSEQYRSETDRYFDLLNKTWQ